MAIVPVGTPAIVETNVTYNHAFGSGWAQDDTDVIIMRVKNTANDVPALPSGYTDIDTEVISTHTVLRICARKLLSTDTPPSINPAGVQIMFFRVTLRGCELSSIAAMIEFVAHTSNVSSSIINYPAATIPDNNCAVIVYGTYLTSGAGNLGTPTTLSGGATQLGNSPYTGADMKGSFWLDIQTAHANISAGNIPITGGSSLTQRGGILVIKSGTPLPSVASAGDGVFYDEETGITASGTNFGAGHTGSADVIVSAVDDINDASAVVQPYGGTWNATTVVFEAELSSFPYFTNLYLFVRDSSGNANANGFVIQREARFRITQSVVYNGAPWASQSNVQYRVTADTINGTVLLSGLNETTDGSGVFETAYYTLTSGGALAPGDPVYITLFLDDPSEANTRGTCVRLTPTYV